MAGESLSDLPRWQEFQEEARKRRRNPMRLLGEYIQERLEGWEDERLDEEIRAQAAASGLTEADAVEFVRQYRKEKAEGRAAS